MTIKNLPQKNTKKYIYWGIGGVGLLIVLIYAILQMMIIPKVDKFVVAKAYLDEATKLRSNGKFEEAILKCNKGLEYKPDYADIYNLRAECYLNLNQPTRGFEDIKKAIDIDSVDITGMLHSTAAQIYAEMYSPPNDYFYSYFEYSLKCKLPLWDYMDEPGFRRVKDDKKVKELLEKYKY